MEAALHGRLDFVQELINADTINMVNANGETALMLVARSANTQLFQYLIASGADTSFKNLGGQSLGEFAHPVHRKVIEEHERFRAQLGSHTKPAVRQPQLLVQEEEPSDAPSTLIQIMEEPSIVAVLTDSLPCADVQALPEVEVIFSHNNALA
eukprot:m.221273 g.221273  ORF g.221273 m.221273 type:complete len:153 (-) comp54163_c0_seq9:276-734(-)